VSTIIDQYLHRHSIARALRAERRIERFMDRTGLPVADIAIVQFGHAGELYPQWSGAIDLIPVIAIEDE
jgi:hypothetical protein